MHFLTILTELMNMQGQEPSGEVQNPYESHTLTSAFSGVVGQPVAYKM